MGENIPPHAAALSESLRAFGYDFQTAIADLIDNSITAGAKNIWINADWEGSESKIYITDDGNGMNQNTLVEAMRFGTYNPLEKRSKKDLGRYGLGLKTASLSLCRKFSVISKTADGVISSRAWDLDHIAKTNSWELLGEANINYQYAHECISSKNSGTVIVWDKLDKVCGSFTKKDKDLAIFMDLLDKTKQHLSMIFHRFIDLPNGLKIFIQDRAIIPWDPFLTRHHATQSKDIEYIKFNKQTISISPYILPHYSMFQQEKDYKSGECVKNWNEHQGFYIYRNNRLLVSGSWLGMFSTAEHYKLARIRIDIPNSLDSEWQLDVKKSKAKFPPQLKAQFNKIASKVRSEAEKIYRHRGKIIQRGATDTAGDYVWEEKIRKGKRFFTINSKHPVISDVLNNLDKKQKASFNNLLKVIAETIPVPLITLRSAEAPNDFAAPYELEKENLKRLLDSHYKNYTKKGLKHKQIIDLISTVEPFNMYPDLLDIINEKYLNGNR